MLNRLAVTAAAASLGLALPAAAMTQADHVRNGDTAPFQLIEMVHKAVGGMLRDPETARYSQVGVYTSAKEGGNVHFCGVVNAKNGLGGYNGPRHFIAIPGKAWMQGQAGFAATYKDLCRPSNRIKDVLGA